jgi:hypothetical protein
MASFLAGVASLVVGEKTELERKLDSVSAALHPPPPPTPTIFTDGAWRAQALGKESHGVPHSLLREIASQTHDAMDYGVIMRAVWGSLDHSGKNWVQIFKVRALSRAALPRDGGAQPLSVPSPRRPVVRQGLTLLEVMVKAGAERVVDDARDHLFRIRTLTDYTHHTGGSDKGAGSECRKRCHAPRVRATPPTLPTPRLVRSPREGQAAGGAAERQHAHPGGAGEGAGAAFQVRRHQPRGGHQHRHVRLHEQRRRR